MNAVADPIVASTAAAVDDVTCAHCAQPVPAGLIVAGAERQFCCPGCRAVYETLHACGLDAYYQLREAAQASSKPVKASDSTFESFDSPSFADLYVQRRDDGMSTVDLVLENVSCAACVWLLERLPRVLPGVIEARLSLRQGIVRVTWDTRVLPLSRVARTLDAIGYRPHPARGQSAKSLHKRETRKRLVRLGVAGALMGNTMLLGLALYAGEAGHMEHRYTTFFRVLSAVLGVASLAWPGRTFFTSAWTAIRLRATNLDVPIALALLVGGVAGIINVVLGRGEIYFDSLTVLVFLLLVGRFIQYQQQRRADDAVGLLFALTPSSCRIVRGDDGVVVDAPIEALKVGDLVEVRPGDLFPADGTVESGRSSVNQALLTGESRPHHVEAGMAVHAGSQNLSSPVRARVTRVGQDTRVGQLVALIERGVQDKPRIVQFADKVGAAFIVVVSLVAAGTFAWWAWRGTTTQAIDHTVALLIVTCPCVLGLATPLTLAIAIGRLARRDILVKSAAALEKLSRGGNLLLDKTGTLTEGRLQLMKWVGSETVKPVVAALEAKSGHVIGRALHDALDVSDLPRVTDLVEANDGGISGVWNGRVVRAGSPRYMAARKVAIPETMARAAFGFERGGATAVMVARDEEVVAVAGLGDKPREDSRAAVGYLRHVRWEPAILSGDATDVVKQVAHLVGIDPNQATGQMSPEEKLSRVKGHGAGRRVTVMVGDGVNDSAALAAADVGIAVHGSPEPSLAAADVYVARPGLQPLVELAETARLAMRTIRRNLVVSLSYNLLAGVLACTGYMTPLIAAVIMPISSATVLSLAVTSITRTPRALRQREGKS